MTRFEVGPPARDGERNSRWDAAEPGGKGGGGKDGRHRGGSAASYGRYRGGQDRNGPEHPPLLTGRAGNPSMGGVAGPRRFPPTWSQRPQPR